MEGRIGSSENNKWCSLHSKHCRGGMLNLQPIFWCTQKVPLQSNAEVFPDRSLEFHIYLAGGKEVWQGYLQHRSVKIPESHGSYTTRGSVCAFLSLLHWEVRCWQMWLGNIPTGHDAVGIQAYSYINKTNWWFMEEILHQLHRFT